MADRDKTARAGAIHDKIAEEVVEFLAEHPIEATLDNTIDLSIELVVLAADRVNEETDEDIVEKLSSIQVLRRLLIILSIHISNWLYQRS